MNSNLITKADLSLPIQEDGYEKGTYLHYNGNSGMELYQLVEDEGDGWFRIGQVNLTDFSTMDSERISLGTLKQYYKPVTVPMEELHKLSQRLLGGEKIEESGNEWSDEPGTELMHLGDKQTLITLKKEVEKAMKVAELVQRHAKCIVDEMKRSMMERVKQMDNMISQMNTQVKRLDYVIQTIETYAGIKENIVTIQSGIPASENTPVIIRQAIIYMDEEMALIDPEFDWQKIKSFDEWLVKEDNYKTLLPDIKSIVAIKPRRYDKKYSDGETVADRWYNWTMNQNNYVTLFLIRNGENVYRIESEHIVLNDRFFPNADEYLEILRKEQEEERRGWHSRDDYKDSVIFRKRFTKVSFLLQGLFERSEVFAPHNFTGSLIRMEGLDGQVEMLYELDHTRLLGDGRPTFDKWVEQLNEGLCEGKRVLLIKKGFNHSGYEFERNDYVTYYSNEWNTPGYPRDGVYTLYKSNPKGYDKYYEASHPFVIKYIGENDTYNWNTGYEKRKNRTSIHICPKYSGILNYDDLSMEDVDYYLHSRLHRSQYHHFVVMLQKVRKLMLEEQAEEENFIRMMKGQMLARGLKVKDGYTPEEIVRKTLTTVKNRLKWKRPVSTKEKETYTLVERNLFSKQNISKYFIQNT